MLYIYCCPIHRHTYYQRLRIPKQDLIFPDDNVAFINGALILSEICISEGNFFPCYGFDRLITSPLPPNINCALFFKLSMHVNSTLSVYFFRDMLKCTRTDVYFYIKKTLRRTSSGTKFLSYILFNVCIHTCIYG